MRPLKGKVDGKNTGKKALVRSLSGIGQVGAMLVGRPSLNQPFSESDLLRERVSTNIGEVSNEEISKLAVTAHVVVSVAAGTPIYVVLEQTAKPNVISPSLTSQGRRDSKFGECRRTSTTPAAAGTRPSEHKQSVTVFSLRKPRRTDHFRTPIQKFAH